jgi:hypothetical protein
MNNALLNVPIAKESRDIDTDSRLGIVRISITNPVTYFALLLIAILG